VLKGGALPKHTERPSLVESYFNSDVELPYGLTVTEVKAAINAAYNLLHDVNAFLVGRGYSRLEDLLLGNAFAGLLSEVLVKSLADRSAALVRNTYVGGHPDLILPGAHPNDAALKATEGIEVKASKQRGGWQAFQREADESAEGPRMDYPLPSCRCQQVIGPARARPDGRSGHTLR
jgi:hypothetical protein